MDVAYFQGYTYIFDVKERFDNIAITECRKNCSFPNFFIIHKIIFMYQIPIVYISSFLELLRNFVPDLLFIC